MDFLNFSYMFSVFCYLLLCFAIKNTFSIVNPASRSQMPMSIFLLFPSQIVFVAVAHLTSARPINQEKLGKLQETRKS